MRRYRDIQRELRAGFPPRPLALRQAWQSRQLRSLHMRETTQGSVCRRQPPLPLLSCHTACLSQGEPAYPFPCTFSSTCHLWTVWGTLPLYGRGGMTVFLPQCRMLRFRFRRPCKQPRSYLHDGWLPQACPRPPLLRLSLG